MGRWLPGSDAGCYVVAAACAVVFLIITGFALFRDRAKGRRRCPKCWYDMAGGGGLRCPECGFLARSERVLHRTRRRWGRVWVASALAIYAVVAVGAPDVTMYGWAHRLPGWVLVRLYPWADRPNGGKRVSVTERPVLSAILFRFERDDGFSAGARRELTARALGELDTTGDALRRRDAYLLLSGTDVEAKACLPRILFHAEREPGPVPAHIARVVIAQLGADDPAVQAYLLELLQALPPDETGGFVSRLPARGPAAAVYVPGLVRLLGAGGDAAHTAARRLLAIGPPAREAVPALRAIAGSEPEPGARLLYNGAIDCIEGRYADDAAFYASLLGADDPGHRFFAASMLASLEVGDRAAPYLDQVIAAYATPRADDSPAMAGMLLRAIGARAGEAERAVPMLKARLADPTCTPSERNEIQTTLRRISGSFPRY